MKYSLSLLVLISICLITMAPGCASRPDEQLELARTAMDEAEEQRASEFARSDWEDAQVAWTEAQSLLSSERYAQARRMLLRAKSRFEKARDIAKSKRDVVLRETKNMQGTIDKRYNLLQNDIADNERRLLSRQRNSLKEACNSIDRGIEKVGAELGQGDYTLARESAQITMRRTYEAEQELQGYLR